MIQISQEIENFIKTNIVEMIQPTLLESLNILLRFNYPDLEAPLLDIIYESDVNDPYSKNDRFLAKITNDLFGTCRSHGIVFDQGNSPTLKQLNNITESFLKLVSLESFDVITNIINDPESDNKMKFCQILNTFYHKELVVYLSLIESVDQNLIDNINDLCIAWQETKDIDIEEVASSTPRLFISFMGDHETIGKRLFENGFDKPITLDDLLNITPFDVIEHINANKNGSVYVALELLSLFMITSDASKEPITFFKERSDLYIHNKENLPIITATFNDMYKNFCIFQEDMKKEQVNEENK